MLDVVDRASAKMRPNNLAIETGKGPHNVYRTPDGKQMIVSAMQGEKLTVIDVKTEQPAFDIAPGGVPRPVVINANPDNTINRSSYNYPTCMLLKQIASYR